LVITAVSSRIVRFATYLGLIAVLSVITFLARQRLGSTRGECALQS